VVAALNSPGRTSWRAGHVEDACSGRTRTAAARSDSKTSPAWGRRDGGDDQWAPLVSDRGRGGGETERRASWAMRGAEQVGRAGGNG
jgi:hypothetical protein